MDVQVDVVGVNGDLVTIAGDNAGHEGIELAPGMKGHYDPPVEVSTRKLANHPGARYVSHRYKERTVTFAVLIDNNPEKYGQTWQEIDARWRALFSYDSPAELRFITDGTSRTLKVYLSEIELETDYDPHKEEMVKVIMEVVALDPFWYEEPVTAQGSLLRDSTVTIPFDDLPGAETPIFPEFIFEGGTSWAIWDTSRADATASGEGTGHRIDIPHSSSAALVSTDPSERQAINQEGSNGIWAAMLGRRFTMYIPARSRKAVIKLKRLSTGGSSRKDYAIVLKQPFDRPW